MTEIKPLKSLNIIAANRQHHATTTVLKNGKVLFSIEEERLNRFKYEGTPFLGILKTPEYIDSVDMIGLSGYLPLNKVEYNTLGFTHNLYSLLVSRTFLKNKDFAFFDFHNEHHLTHAAGAFFNSGFDKALSIVLDGAGSRIGERRHLEETYSSFLFEYPCKYEVIEKTFFNNELKQSKDNLKSLGRFYSVLTLHFGFNSEYDCGKVMGISSYGKKILDIDWLNFFDKTGMNVNKNHELYEKTKKLKDFQLCADLAYTLQDYVQTKCLNIIKELIKKTNCKNICLSGGYILNCVSNYFVRKNLPEDVKIYVEPISHDGGTSIGAAKLIHHLQTGDTSKNPQTTTYYGCTYNKNDVKQKIINENTKTVTKKDVASLLADNKIVAIYQGRSEQGPRALGNRSILFNPKNSKGKNIVNTVKKRESFRPFAGTVLYEKSKEYFDMSVLDESPFMCYAVDVNKNKVKEIPAIVHVDNTCRIQTLKRDFNIHFYDLIKEFDKLTNTPILLNTSFNLAGEPMVETIEDALKTLHNSDIDYLYLPELNTLIQ